MIGRSPGVAGHPEPRGSSALFEKYKVTPGSAPRRRRKRTRCTESAMRQTTWQIDRASAEVTFPPATPGGVRRQARIINYKEAMSLGDAAEVDGHHRRRADRPGVRLLPQGADRHQDYGHRADGSDRAGRGRSHRRRRGQTLNGIAGDHSPTKSRRPGKVNGVRHLGRGRSRPRDNPHAEDAFEAEG